MHWQLGGNFGPVLKACEYRWMECSYALAHYIWFEVVTDVADSLANELILWRILAVILIVMTIIHFMYWKKQWIKEINVTNETLKNVDFKVQDLELKMNILTYKAQYDTWPLPQLVALNNESDFENNSSTFPKLNEQNTYLKYFLERTRRKSIENEALTYNEPRSLLSELNVKYISSNEKLMQQTSYTEKKLSLTSVEQKRFKSDQSDNKGLKHNSAFNLSEEPAAEENFKLYRSSSDNSLNDHLRSTYLGSKKITKINVKPGKLLHRKRMSPEITEKQLKFSLSSTNNSSSSKYTLLPKFLKQNYHSSYQDNKEATHETLKQVKEKLQCLHSTLRHYTDDFELNTLNNSQTLNKVGDNIQKASTSQDNNKYRYIKNQQGDCNYDESVNFKKSIHAHRATTAINPNLIKTDKTSKISSQEYERSNEKLKKKEYIFGANDKFKYKHTEEVNNLLENNNTTKTKPNLHNHSNFQTNEMITDFDNNQQINLAEFTKESDSDDRSITALIEEALKFKQELLLQFESRKEKDEMIVQNIRNQDDTYDYSNWHSDSDFEPNSLGKITEESSASSVADKKSKTHILITAENYNDQNASKNNSSLLSQHSSNRIVESAISNKKTNSSEILSKNSEKKTKDELKTSRSKTEEINHSNLNTNLEVDSNINLLSDTSSDTSVNRLIDRLIESERKSAKSLTSAKNKEDAVDSMDTFVIPDSFFDNPPFESKQHSLPVKFDAERHFAETTDTSVNPDKIQESESIKIICDARRGNSNQNAQDNLFVRDAAKLNTLVTEDKEISQNISNQHFDQDNYLSINDDNITTLSRNIDNSKNVKSMSELQNDEMGNKRIIGKKAVGDFYSDSEIISQKNIQNSKKNIFPSVDSNSLESNTYPKSIVKLKSNLYHSSCKGQTDSHIQTSFRSSDQCPTKSSNSTSKQSAKINFESSNSKQTKAKSNLNLSTIENINALPTHRRSKSHVTSSDSPLMNQNKRAESENILMKLDQKVSNKALSKPCTPQPSRNCSNDIVIQFQIKKNMSSSLSSKSSSKTSVPISRDSNVDNNLIKNDIQRKISDESVTSKSSTKSCIPILKTRLELVINDDNDFHPKSLSAGSLKMNAKCFELEEDSNNIEKHVEQQENQNVSELMEGKKRFKNSGGPFDLEYCTNTHDYVSTYINTMIDSNQLGTNANNENQIFDELEIELDKHTTSNDQMDSGLIKEKEASFFSEQDVLFDSLERHNDDVINMISQEPHSLEVQNASSRALSHKDSKETEVPVKPCTLEMNASTTNATNIESESNSKASELKALEVPEQLSKKEYDSLLQLINDHPDFEHLLNLGLQK